MRAPDFWWRDPPSLPARLLAPVGALYGAAAARRMARPGAPAPCPVVCVGNVTLGGAGKTPTALALAALLRELGARPAFLSRGYGGSLPGPLRVDPAAHGAAEVGDEPLLLARAAPTIVARDRPTGAAACAAAGADVIVMDDGLQNPSLRKDWSLAVFDAGVGIGNGLPFPAGPLRAPLGAQWPLVSAVLVIGDAAQGRPLLAAAAARGLPALRGRLAPDAAAAAALRGRPVLAFAGIGRPDKFFESLRAVGAELRGTRAFPDHHAYRAGEIAALEREATRRGLTLVTTEKDRVRLPAAMAVAVLPVRLALAPDDAALLRARLAALLRGRAGP
ncbi:tetraacyldisaccharide 4'-kinase [Methylobacterium sp. WSM2598]|uniref:tetraacyldisaccharide 4'-kinase n=1 Tax=Methylobacterium sp. WSM2598 TaxID=398261 RepID=UPI00036044B8|nr:tetraacyldisaccharide 4'-kinase [Methylobacterium sp. WSM2598]